MLQIHAVQGVKRGVTGLLGGVLLFSLTCSGAMGLPYLKFDGVDGESEHEFYEDWSLLTNLDWGVNVSVSQHTGTLNRQTVVDFLDLKWSQLVDRSTPKLFENIATGKVMQKATVDLLRTGGDDGRANEPYFQMIFEDVILTMMDLDMSESGAGINGGFTYGRVTMNYWTQDRNGKRVEKFTASHDLRTGKVSSAMDVASLYALGISDPGTSAVPIPAPLWLLGSALGWLALRRKQT